METQPAFEHEYLPLEARAVSGSVCVCVCVRKCTPDNPKRGGMNTNTPRDRRKVDITVLCIQQI